MSRAGQRILSLIQSTATRVAKQYAPQLFYGEVTSTSPLKIRIDERYEVGESFLLLDSRCVETRIRIPQDDNYEHIHEEDESLGYLAGTGNMGAPLLFMMAGVPPYLPNPNYIDPVTTPDEPPGLPNDDFDPASLVPSPSLKLTHAHTIHPALESILLWRGLEEGDRVKVLRISTSLHYVMERVEGVTNDPSQ